MYTYETAPDQYIKIGDIKFAYRRLGLDYGIPLVLLMHFRGTMDHWDPLLINKLAAKRPILLIDNAGVGRSEGAISEDYAGWAKHYADVVLALGITKVDVMGFSMGGAAAQMLALNYSELVRRVILAGTFPSVGEGVTTAELGPYYKYRGAVTPEEKKEAFINAFFDASDSSRAAGVAAWDRITSARSHRSEYVDIEGSDKQSKAFIKFLDPEQAAHGSYGRLEELKKPVLIANGKNDLMIPRENSYTMYKKIPNAQLHLYSDSGHGFLFQYAGQFSRLVNDFLDDSSIASSRL